MADQGDTDAPAARRLQRRRWTDPRFVVGAVLVAASVVAGAAVVSAQDRTTAVWAVAADVRAGEQPERSDLQQVRVHLSADVMRRYLAVDSSPIDSRLEGTVWAHDVRAGELVGASALVPADGSRVGELPLPVTPGSMPADLSAGERVDVWIRPERSADDVRTHRLLESVAVLDVQTASSALGDSAAQTVLVALGKDTVDDLRGVLEQLEAGKVTLVRLTGSKTS